MFGEFDFGYFVHPWGKASELIRVAGEQLSLLKAKKSLTKLPDISALKNTPAIDGGAYLYGAFYLALVGRAILPISENVAAQYETAARTFYDRGSEYLAKSSEDKNVAVILSKIIELMQSANMPHLFDPCLSLLEAQYREASENPQTSLTVVSEKTPDVTKNQILLVTAFVALSGLVFYKSVLEPEMKNKQE